MPSYTFGENELFERVDAPPGSWAQRLQNTLLAYFGFTIPWVHGRGIFQYSWGFMPRRTPLHTVLGEPIPVPPAPPSGTVADEDVRLYHDRYVAALETLFNKYRAKYHHPTDFQGQPLASKALNIIR